MGELCPRAPVVELVADVADVTHHRHEEFYTWGTAGSVCSHSPGEPGVPPSLGTHLLPHPPGGRREEDKGIGCLGRMLWLGSGEGGSPGGWGQGWGLTICGVGAIGLPAFPLLCGSISGLHLETCSVSLGSGFPQTLPPECRWGAWNPPILLNTLTLHFEICMAFSEPWYMLILPPRVPSPVYTL